MRRGVILSIFALSVLTAKAEPISEIQPDTMATLLSADTLSADTTVKKKPSFRFGATAGIGANNVHFSDNEPAGKLRAFHFRVGGEVDWLINKNMFVESGLTFQKKGYKTHNDSYQDVEWTKVNFYYLQVPLTFNYAFYLPDEVTLIPEAGLYFGVALGGKSKRECTDAQGTKTYTKPVFGDNEVTDLKRFDTGLRICFNALFIQQHKATMGYEWGINNLSQNRYTKQRNSVFFIAYTYYLKTKKREAVAEQISAESETEHEAE